MKCYSAYTNTSLVKYLNEYYSKLLICIEELWEVDECEKYFWPETSKEYIKKFINEKETICLQKGHSAVIRSILVDMNCLENNRFCSDNDGPIPPIRDEDKQLLLEAALDYFLGNWRCH